jgi:hypothetical protein
MTNAIKTEAIPIADIPQTMNEKSAVASTTLLLGHAGGWWDFWMICSLAAAAFVAVFIVFFTAGSVIIHKREAATASDELGWYKLETNGKVAAATESGIAAGKAAGAALLRAAALEKEAQELKAANLILEAKIQPRRLSGEESKKLSAALSSLHPLAIGIVSRLFDPEGADFADDFAKAFDSAKWQAVRQRDWTMSDRGVAIATFDGTSIHGDLAKRLLDALASANVKATVITITKDQQNTTSAHFQPNALYLLIGAKPE